ADGLLPAALLERGLAGIRLRSAAPLLEPPPAARPAHRRHLQRHRRRALDPGARDHPRAGAPRPGLRAAGLRGRYLRRPAPREESCAAGRRGFLTTEPGIACEGAPDR